MAKKVPKVASAEMKIDIKLDIVFLEINLQNGECEIWFLFRLKIILYGKLNKKRNSIDIHVASKESRE